jgi:hypothetical protein
MHVEMHDAFGDFLKPSHAIGFASSSGLVRCLKFQLPSCPTHCDPIAYKPSSSSKMLDNRSNVYKWSSYPRLVSSLNRLGSFQVYLLKSIKRASYIGH